MGHREKGIAEIVCRMSDGSKVIYKNSEEIQEFIIPPACETVAYITGSEKVREFEAKLLKKIKDNESLEPSEKQIENRYRTMLQNTGAANMKYMIGEADPKLVYTDVTETEMFGFPEITKTLLNDSDIGLWAYYGVRKLKLTMHHLIPRAKGYKIRALLYFNKKDNEEIPEICMKQFVMKKMQDSEIDTYEIFCYLDTNRLGNEFSDYRQKLLFSGYLEVSFIYESVNMNDVTYCFPVELRLNNTNYKAGKRLCVPLQRNTVSIDFGTSSSCVAIKGNKGIELLTLSADEAGQDGINIYENPTCVMIYRWKEIYQQWRMDNDYFPLIEKGTLQEEKQNEKAVQYDFGYSVKGYMHQVNDKELNSIITEIKMIPKLLHEQNQISVRPFVDQYKKTIKLVDSFDKQDEESLDIVAFYGYILGKAINRIEKNKIYTKYQITYPVKFNNELKKKMCASLEYGLKRSVPIPLRNAVDEKGNKIFKVEMKYPEPVAYIGSMCGKYLKIDKANPKAQLFAVFDFGGGTLDYSFGVFELDQDDPNNSVIHILGIDGDSSIGGEELIRKMSYWIYTSPTNISEFIKKRIPIEQPAGEALPDHCPQELFYSTASAKSNIRKINERITRSIFEGRFSDGILAEDDSKTAWNDYSEDDGSAIYDDEEETEYNLYNHRMDKKRGLASSSKEKVELIEFLNLDDNAESIEVSFDVRELDEQLEALLYKTVIGFKSSMERVFSNNMSLLNKCGIKKFQVKDVNIFKGGNSSRNKILDKIMDIEFPDNHKLLVDETSSECMSAIKGQNGEIMQNRPKQVAITPKTAVAYGQLRLSDYEKHLYFEEEGSFNWYVGLINGATNEFQIVIDKVNQSNDWQYYKRINSLDMRIHYSETFVRDGDDINLRDFDLSDDLKEEWLKKYLYVKIKDSDTLLGCVCDRRSQPDDLCTTFVIPLQ